MLNGRCSKYKVALVYDRVNKWGGAERVLLTLHQMFPKAPLYTLIYDPKKAPWAKVFPKVVPSFLQKIPILKNYHELLGWLAPIAFESFDFSKFDLVISLTSEAAKGILTQPTTKHLCLMLTPTRYLWSGYVDYKTKPQKPLSYIPFYKWLSHPFLAYLKYWDRLAAQRPDQIIAISTRVQKRIKRYYDRDSNVIFPPVEIDKFAATDDTLMLRNIRVGKGECFLVVSRLVPYKKVDLVVEAFNILGKKLIVVGTGSEESKLKSMSKRNINFIGFVGEKKLAELYKNAKALIMPQDEDFGIVAVEAQAAGCPVVSFKRSGVRDTVIDGVTGVFFERQNVKSLVDAVKRFDRMDFRAKDLIGNAKKFSKKSFINQFAKVVNSLL
jgi:glycosyltransferase involved in cell wall biosynthesis